MQENEHGERKVSCAKQENTDESEIDVKRGRKRS
jgi:hypothetical protein